jgi:opacity protein-like surface antigen
VGRFNRPPRSRAALGACIGAGAFASAAQAQQGYPRVEGGGGFADKYGDVANGDLGKSWRAGAALGAHISPRIRVEGEYFHTGARFQSGAGASSADIAIANAYYDFGSSWTLNPFLGGGIGDGYFAPTGGRDSSVTYQAIAGVSKAIAPRLTGEIAYKFVDAPDLTIVGANTDYHSSFITAGLRMPLGR